MRVRLSAILASMGRCLWIIFFAVLSTPLGSRADELTLKDGTKIVGAIVGFEQNSFKVRTSFGFALVRKDQVASISVSDTARPAAEGKSDPGEPVKEPEARKATKTPEDAGQEKQTASPPANAAASVNPDLPRGAATPAAPSPLDPIREQVIGNTYSNQTFGFQMYKPPAWQVIAGVSSLLPGAIAAMGTNDQTTYLLVGQQAAGKSVENARDAAERRLREILENFRPVGESSVTISGAPAVEIRFRGSIEAHDWSGMAAFVPHGGRLFTIFGMTLADSDLVQIQENVLARAISSLQFTK